LRIVISIFCLPYEIDELENTLNQLKRASYYLSGKNEWVVDVTLSLSNDLINWERVDHKIKFNSRNQTWDSSMRAYPCIIHLNGSYYLFYNGNSFGKEGFGYAKLK